MKRNVAIVTGSRAEYGLLYWLMKEIQEDPSFNLQIIVTGTHLAPDFGYTCQQIESDGFKPDEKIEIILPSDTPSSTTKSMGLALQGFADSLERLRPDLLVVLGDRYEILAAATASMIAGIPIAHLHGGETSEGAWDEAFRHAITKMSHLHFVAAEPYRKRVVQLGEDPCRVFNVGAIGLDHLTKTTLLNRPDLERELGFTLGKQVFLVTFHPATLGGQDPKVAVNDLIQALNQFPDATIVITKANADAGGRVINAEAAAYAARYSHRIHLVSSLGSLKYLSLMKHCDVVIGNSSSGIIEAPSLGIPTVNIGPRQKGRLRAPSIIDCAEDTAAVHSAITKALLDSFKKSLLNMICPYGEGNAARKILECLKATDFKKLTLKKFHDL